MSLGKSCKKKSCIGVQYRSSHRRCSIEKTVLKNFAIFTGKDLCWSLFFNKVAGLQVWHFTKKRLQHSFFPMNIEKFLRTLILKNICERLLLSIKKLFWKISQNSQEKNSARVSFLMTLQAYISEYSWRYCSTVCFCVNFSKCVGTVILQSTSGLLLLPTTPFNSMLSGSNCFNSARMIYI